MKSKYPGVLIFPFSANYLVNLLVQFSLSNIFSYSKLWTLQNWYCQEPIFQVQLSVTPGAEGTLAILGVRWKLSGTIVGSHNFELSQPKNNIVKGRRKAKRSPNDMFKFMVIKVHAVVLPFLIIVFFPNECRLLPSCVSL